jgi:hypothetical protein
LVKKIAELLGYPEYYFYTVNDDFAKAVLQFHRERTDPESNPHYNSVVIEARKLASKLDKVRKLVAQLTECLKEASRLLVTLPRFACPTPDFYTKNLRKNQGLRVFNGGMM